MGTSVPAGAAELLRFIRAAETGHDDASAYDTIYGHNEDSLAKPLTTMTIGEVVDAQTGWTRRFKSSAAGAYQIMKATLQELSRSLQLRGDQIFDATLQDRLGFALIKRRGYADFMAGDLSLINFGRNVAREWASMPVLAACRGAHCELARGQSYYAGDALNRALVDPDRFEAVLNQAYAAEHPVNTTPIAPWSDTEHIQTLLCRAGYPVAVDGIRGPQTQGAIKAFQRVHGLKVDGIIGPKTFVALTNALDAA